MSLVLETQIQTDYVMHRVETWGRALYLLSFAPLGGLAFGAIGSFIFAAASIALLWPILQKHSWRPSACLAAGILAGVAHTAAAWAIHATPSSEWTLHNIVSGVLGTWPLVERLDGEMMDKVVGSAAPIFSGIVAALAFSWLTRSQAAAT
jgi:hypothetical protein